MDGSREIKCGPVVLSCMSREARDLLDEAIAKYAAFKGVSEDSLCGPSGVYSFAYWLFRYSGLVKSATE